MELKDVENTIQSIKNTERLRNMRLDHIGKQVETLQATIDMHAKDMATILSKINQINNETKPVNVHIFPRLEASQKPQRHGTSWSRQEESDLLQSLYRFVEEQSFRHQRSTGAIFSKLRHMKFVNF